jgi:hypothetical protein
VAVTGTRKDEEVETKLRESEQYADLKREKREAARRVLTIAAKMEEGFRFHLIKLEGERERDGERKRERERDG